MNQNLVINLEENKDGVDFVVGDIHGNFDMLEVLLDRVGFDSGSDRLIAVGDLIDRGPYSWRCVEFIEKPWFYSVRGNHEDMAIKGQDDHNQYHLWISNGGTWWIGMNEYEKQDILHAIRSLPIAIEVKVGNERYGIVHADVPSGYTWDEMIDLICKDERIQYSVVWDRTRFTGYYFGGRNVDGVNMVFCGHTPTQEIPVVRDNVTCLDTGAAYGGALTLVNLKTKQFHSVTKQDID